MEKVAKLRKVELIGIFHSYKQNKRVFTVAGIKMYQIGLIAKFVEFLKHNLKKIIIWRPFWDRVNKVNQHNFNFL